MFFKKCTGNGYSEKAVLEYEKDNVPEEASLLIPLPMNIVEVLLRKSSLLYLAKSIVKEQ